MKLEEVLWESSLIESADAVTGNPVTPAGRALQGLVTLPRFEWTCELQRGDPVLDFTTPVVVCFRLWGSPARTAGPANHARPTQTPF
jgi:hypothetical protein